MRCVRTRSGKTSRRKLGISVRKDAQFAMSCLMSLANTSKRPSKWFKREEIYDHSPFRGEEQPHRYEPWNFYSIPNWCVSAGVCKWRASLISGRLNVWNNFGRIPTGAAPDYTYKVISEDQVHDAGRTVVYGRLLSRRISSLAHVTTVWRQLVLMMATPATVKHSRI